MISRRLLRIKVLKAMYGWLVGGMGDVKLSRKELRASIDATYDLYFLMLWLIVEVRRLAAERIELGRSKYLPTEEEKNPNTKFVDNPFIRSIADSEVVRDRLKKRKLRWSEDVIRDVYNSLTQNELYSSYMSSEGGDQQFVRDFFSAPFVEDNELLEEALEERSVLWSDDAGFAIIMVDRTLEKMKQGRPLRVVSQFRGDEDEKFADRLFVAAVHDYDDNLRLVERFSANWDVERIALMDNLIATTATAEMHTFPDIPTRVVLDEYIEISKYYSTHGSNQFINGVLDKIAGEVRQ